MYEAMLQAAVYCRVSTKQQEDDGSSLDTQQAACLSLAEEKGFTVPPHLIFREVYSGANLYDRPALNSLRKLVREHQLKGVIVYSLDRLTREQSHIGIITSELDKHGVELYSVRDGELSRGAIGEFITTAKVFVAQFEREQILERTMRGKFERIHTKKKPVAHGRAPFGYRWDGEDGKKDRLVENPETAPVLRRLYQDLMAGITAVKLAERLNLERVPTPSGRQGARWTAATITQLVRRRLYLGEYAANRWQGYSETLRDKQRGPGRLAPKEGIILDNVAEPLVSEELWNVVQETLTSNQSVSIRNSKQPEDALLRAGHVFCGYCGCSCVAYRRSYSAKALENPRYNFPSNRKGPGPAYTCQSQNRKKFGCPSHSILSRVLDPVIWEFVVDTLSDEVTFRAELERRQGTDPTQHDRRAIEEQLTRIAREEQQFQDSLTKITNQAVVDSLIQRINDLGTMRQSLEREYQKLMKRYETYQEMETHIDTIMTWVREKRDELLSSQASYAQKRRALQMLGVKVYLYSKDREEGRGVIEWCLPVSQESIRRVVFDNSRSSEDNSTTLVMRWTLPLVA